MWWFSAKFRDASKVVRGSLLSLLTCSPFVSMNILDIARRRRAAPWILHKVAVWRLVSHGSLHLFRLPTVSPNCMSIPVSGMFVSSFVQRFDPCGASLTGLGGAGSSRPPQGPCEPHVGAGLVQTAQRRGQPRQDFGQGNVRHAGGGLGASHQVPGDGREAHGPVEMSRRALFECGPASHFARVVPGVRNIVEQGCLCGFFASAPRQCAD